MRTLIQPAFAPAALLAAALSVTPALALNNKSYVSGSGGDLNDCATVATACATLGTALFNTTPGGEITVVDTGNYGVVVISQSVHITNDGGGEASLLGLRPVIIDAGPGDVVSLRGWVIDGIGLGAFGVFAGQASAVHIQNCVIRNFTGTAVGPQFGILYEPPTAGQLFVSNTIILNNGSTAGTGGIVVRLLQASGSANVVLDRVHLENNAVGLLVDGSRVAGNGAHVVIRDSVVSGNALDGIRAFSLSGNAPAFLVVERTAAVSNGGTGIVADGPRATMLLSGNVVSRNGAGIGAVNSGQLISYGNNKVNNNLGPDGTPTGSFSPI